TSPKARGAPESGYLDWPESLRHQKGRLSASRVASSSATAPPYGDSANDDQERQQKLAGHTNPTHLSAGQRDATVIAILWPNGNQILIRRQPIHGIERQIAIAIEADERVCHPGGAADNHEAALRVFLAGVVGSRGGDSQGPFRVFGVARVNRWAIQLDGGKTRI